jgi:hypothetical protein
MRVMYERVLTLVKARESFFKTNKFLFGLWFAITLTFVIQSLVTHRYNNYLIFENTWRNLIWQQSLYAPYPAYHGDTNHYGPVFSLLIAPFAILSNGFGLLFWNLFNCIVLFRAILALPVSYQQRQQISYIALPCLVASMLNQQFNAAATAFIILSYTLLNKDKGLWSAMFIVLGTFIKLYGIVGLAFFFFVKDKPRFILWLLVWSATFFVLPILFSSPEFILRSYYDWELSLMSKNLQNMMPGSTDISIMGFIRDLFSQYTISNTSFLATGIALFMIPYLRFRSFGNQQFQLLILASTLLFPVLFSTGSEDCTYIIAIPGVGIWFIFEHDIRLKKYLLPVLIVFTCNIPALFFPSVAHRFPILLTMLSVPFFMVWLRIVYNAWQVKC